MARKSPHPPNPVVGEYGREGGAGNASSSSL